MLIATVQGVGPVMSGLDAFLSKSRTGVRDAVSRLTLQLLRKVKEEKLSGQVLRNRTGTLRRSINPKFEQGATSYAGYVGTNLVYARAHELGCHKTVTVREHLVHITSAFGQALKSPVTFTMPAHQMRMNLPERSFLRSALEEMRPQVLIQLRNAMAGGAK